MVLHIRSFLAVVKSVFVDIGEYTDGSGYGIAFDSAEADSTKMKRQASELRLHLSKAMHKTYAKSRVLASERSETRAGPVYTQEATQEQQGCL